MKCTIHLQMFMDSSLVLGDDDLIGCEWVKNWIWG